MALGAHGWGGLACGSGSSQQGSRGRGRSMAQGPLARVAQGLRAAAWGSGSGSSRLIHSTHSAIATAQILPPTCSYYPNMLQHAPTLCVAQLAHKCSMVPVLHLPCGVHHPPQPVHNVADMFHRSLEG